MVSNRATAATATVDPSQLRTNEMAPLAGWRRWLTPHPLLVLVSAAYCLAGFLLIPHTLAFSWDEVVYLSQVARGVEPVELSAPRAWGTVILGAPIAMITPSIVVIRSYLTFVSGLALYIAFRPWLGVASETRKWHSYVAPAAAGGFATLWTTLYHGDKALPNLWLAFALVAGVGNICRATMAPHSRGPLIGVFLAFTAASLLRPTDAAAASAGILVTMALVPSMRSVKPAAALACGMAIGWTVWIAEAFVRFGGPLERLRTAAEIVNGGAGAHFTFREHLYAVDGPYLPCIPKEVCAGIEWQAAVWWFALPLLALLGIVVARKSGLTRHYLLPAASAFTFLIPYSALTPEGGLTRFILAAYALLMVPTAYFFVWAFHHTQKSKRRVTIALICILLATHVTVQHATLNRALEANTPTSMRFAERARILQEEFDLRRPCLLFGLGSIQLSYLTRCAGIYSDRPPQSSETVIEDALAKGQRVVILVRATSPLPAPYSYWNHIKLPASGSLLAYVSPG